MKTFMWALVGLALGFVMIFVAKSKAPQPESPQPQTVFVDIDTLVALHPGVHIRDDLGIIATEISGAGKLSAEPDAWDNPPAPIPAEMDTQAAEQARQNMSDQVLGSTERVLRYWEADRKKALAVRMERRKRFLLARAQQEIWENQNEIYSAVGQRQRDVELKYGLDLLNYRLAINELEQGSVLHGYRPPEIPPKLDELKSVLDALQSGYVDDHRSIVEWMNAETGSISDRALSRVDSTIAESTDRTMSAIRSDMDIARQRISSRLETVNGGDLQRLSIVSEAAPEATVQIRPKFGGQVAAQPGAQGPGNMDAQLARETRDDVVRIVLGLAKKIGVQVTFNRSEGEKFKDYTDKFTQSISSGVW